MKNNWCRVLSIVSMVLIVGCELYLPRTEESREGTGSGGTSEPLTFMEQQLAGKWQRYHGYDGSNEYFIFHEDRSACYFEVTSSGSIRDHQDYAYWALNEDNPISTNVFGLITKTTQSSAPYYRKDEFHYAANEFWIGGYSNLVMTPSTTWRECPK